MFNAAHIVPLVPPLLSCLFGRNFVFLPPPRPGGVVAVSTEVVICWAEKALGDLYIYLPAVCFETRTISSDTDVFLPPSRLPFLSPPVLHGACCHVNVWRTRGETRRSYSSRPSNEMRLEKGGHVPSKTHSKLILQRKPTTLRNTPRASARSRLQPQL